MAKFGELRLVWLEAFVQVADDRKRTAAAKAMEIHQGTVTKHIQKLEQWLGGGNPAPNRRMLLFDEASGTLTAGGERLLPIARQILQLAKEAHKPASLAATPYAPPPPRLSAKGLKPPASFRPPKDG